MLLDLHQMVWSGGPPPVTPPATITIRGTAFVQLRASGAAIVQLAAHGDAIVELRRTATVQLKEETL